MSKYDVYLGLKCYRKDQPDKLYTVQYIGVSDMVSMQHVPIGTPQLLVCPIDGQSKGIYLWEKNYFKWIDGENNEWSIEHCSVRDTICQFIRTMPDDMLVKMVEHGFFLRTDKDGSEVAKEIGMTEDETYKIFNLIVLYIGTEMRKENNNE